LLFDRKDAEGKRIKKYSDFIEYLLSKHSEIKILQLDFEGRNILLYFLAEFQPLKSVEELLLMPKICKNIVVDKFVLSSIK
jgi:hypothetical protein